MFAESCVGKVARQTWRRRESHPNLVVESKTAAAESAKRRLFARENQTTAVLLRATPTIEQVNDDRFEYKRARAGSAAAYLAAAAAAGHVHAAPPTRRAPQEPSN